MTTDHRKSIGIFGGTFDPVHRGHITIAQDIQQQLQLDEMRLMPCRLPPHRGLPQVSDQDRLQMLRIATQNTTLTIDEHELRRDGPSYTVDTLLSLRQEIGDHCSLVLCMGFDAFADFNRWHRWLDIPELAHIVVVTRAKAGQTPHDDKLNPDLIKLLATHQTQHKNDLGNFPAGKIYLTQFSEIPVSSTLIRQALQREDRYIPDLNPQVHQFIQQRGLYRP